MLLLQKELLLLLLLTSMGLFMLHSSNTPESFQSELSRWLLSQRFQSQMTEIHKWEKKDAEGKEKIISHKKKNRAEVCKTLTDYTSIIISSHYSG